LENLPRQISSFVENHFPSFYREEGENFVAFVKAYYEWLESETQVIGQSRKLLNYFDVDRSVEEFVTNFKQKYLVNFPLLAESDQKTFIKKASEIYRSKGSPRSIELLFRLLFNQSIEIYYPATDVLRPSDGKWYIPIYLELSEAHKTPAFVGNQIVGQKSQARAIVSKIARRTILGKTFDVAYLTNVEGDFQTGEIVSYDGLIEDSPTVIGSLSRVLINNAGQNFEIGNIVNLISNRTGIQAKGVVTATEPATGKVDYSILDGGSGYTLTSNVIISERVITFNNYISNSVYTTTFQEEEPVTQYLTYAPFISASGEFEDDCFVYGIDTSINPNVTIASGYVVDVSQEEAATSGSLIINEIPTSIITIDTVQNANSSGSFIVGEKVFQYSSDTDFKEVIGYVLQSNSTNVVVDTSIGSFTVNVLVYGESSNCSANVTSVTLINGSFTNTDITAIRSDYTTPVVNAAIVTLQVEDRTISATVVGANTRHLGINNFDASLSFYSGEHAWLEALYSGSQANIVAISTGSPGGFDVGSLTDTENIFVNPDLIGANNSANVPFLSMTIDGNGINSNVGFLDSVTVVDGGSGYTNSDIVTITGGTPSVLAVATVNTNSDGSIHDIVITNPGSGYDSAPTIQISGGTGADIQPVIDPGYGFIKNVDGDFYSVIDTCLRKLNLTVGTISSLTNINPGANNTASPFVKVINPDVAGFGRRNFKLSITGNTKPFLVGEEITQQILQPIITLTLSSMSGAFNASQLETIKQVRDDGETVYGDLLTATFDDGDNTGTLRILVNDAGNTFDTSNTVEGLTSTSTGTVDDVATESSVVLGKGRVIASNANEIDIFRTRFGTSFSNNNVIFGSITGAQAIIQAITEIDDSLVYGKNAIINSPARSAEGTISTIDVFNSGFGYTNGELLSIRTSNNAFVATGYAQLLRQGQGEGEWLDTGSFVDSDKKIQDSNFYQEFSYQIKSNLSLDRYESILKDTVHVAGTNLFGRIDTTTLLNAEMQTEDVTNRAATLSFQDGNNLEFSLGEEVAQYSGNIKGANGTLDSITSYVAVNGANSEFIIGEQLSRPTLFANTSYGEITSVTYDLVANTATIYMGNTRGVFVSSGQVQTFLDRVQLAYNLTSYTTGVGGGTPIPFEYPEVVYQSNGTANVGVGNITSANATHLIIKPATKLLVSSKTGDIDPGDTIYQRANSSSPNTAIGVVGLSNSTVVEVIDPRGQFVSGEKIFTDSGNAQVASVSGKSDLFTKSNTVVISVNNLTDIGFLNGEIIFQPATGATGTLLLGNTSVISVTDVDGTFITAEPIFGSNSGVQANLSRVEGPFSIIGVDSGANGEITGIDSYKVNITLQVNSSIGALNSMDVSNVAGHFTYGDVVVGSNSGANGTITTVSIQAY
jgi:hypothetical protein